MTEHGRDLSHRDETIESEIDVDREGNFTVSGLDIFYTRDEVAYLGDGDAMRGIVRILDELESPGEMGIDDIMNPRSRPFQDELTILSPMDERLH